MEFEFDTQEFYWKFYSSCNTEIYVWWFVKDYKIIWMKLENENLSIDIFNKISWWYDSLYLNISKALKDYKFIKETTKEEFSNKIDIYKQLLDIK